VYSACAECDSCVLSFGFSPSRARRAVPDFPSELGGVKGGDPKAQGVALRSLSSSLTVDNPNLPSARRGRTPRSGGPSARCE